MGGPKKRRRPVPKKPSPHDPNPFSNPQDGTLLLTTTTRPVAWGPANADDWRYFNANVPEKLAALVEEGFEICVLG